MRVLHQVLQSVEHTYKSTEISPKHNALTIFISDSILSSRYGVFTEHDPGVTIILFSGAGFYLNTNRTRTSIDFRGEKLPILSY